MCQQRNGMQAQGVRGTKSARWWCNATLCMREIKIFCGVDVLICQFLHSIFYFCFVLRLALLRHYPVHAARSHSIRRRRFYRHFLKMHIFRVHAYHSNHFPVHPSILPPGKTGVRRVRAEEVQRAVFSVNIRMHSTNSKPSNEWKFQCECEHSFVYAEYNEKYCVLVFAARTATGCRMNVCWHVSERIIKIIDISTQLFEIQQKRKAK